MVRGRRPTPGTGPSPCTRCPERPAPARPRHRDPAVRGRYSVTMARSCSGVTGTCLAMGATDGGVLVLRLYVPRRRGPGRDWRCATADRPLRGRGRSTPTLRQATGSTAVPDALDGYRGLHGALPAAVYARYLPAAPVPVPVTDPVPEGSISHGTAPTPTRTTPTSTSRCRRPGRPRGDGPGPDLPARPGAPRQRPRPHRGRGPPGRYRSLCIVLKGRHTGDCLRDEQVAIPPGTSALTVIVSPTCPVAGYTNCLVSGPAQLQTSISYRNLLPSLASPRWPSPAPTG